MSYKIERILVPVDFSETSEFAIYTAAAMAMLFKSELSFIHVVKHNESSPAALNDVSVPVKTDLVEQANIKLHDLQNKIKVYSGIQANILVTTGNVQKGIRKYAESEQASLIIMGTHGISGYQEYFIGSNAQRVVTLSSIPVLTLRKEKDILGFKNILMAFDNSLYSRTKVNLAIEIADVYGANVHILGVLDSKDKVEKNKFNVKVNQVEGLIRARNLHCEVEVIFGDNIAKAAMAYAEEHKCDLMVINTGHESKITGIFLGAFAQQVVNHSTIPVLSIKPSETNYSGSGSGSNSGSAI